MKCENKNSYNTIEEAQAAANAVSERKNIHLKVYLCTECGMYHVSRKDNYRPYYEFDKTKRKKSKRDLSHLIKRKK